MRDPEVTADRAEAGQDGAARLRSVTALWEIGRRMLAAASRQEALDAVVHGLVDRLGYFCASVGLLEGGGSHIAITAWRSRVPRRIPADYRQPADRGVVARVLQRRVPALVPDVRRDEDYVPLFPEVRSELCLPLLAGGRVLGVLDVNSDATGAFGGDEARTLESLAGQLAHVLQRQDQLQAVVEARDYLECLIEAAGDAIISTDRSGRIRRWNRAAEKIFGYGAKAALGQPVEVLWPSGEETAAREMFTRVIQGEEVQGVETRRLHRDGTVRDVLLSLSPIRDDGGQVVGMTGVLRDVSQQKRMQARFAEVHRQVSASELKYRSLVEHAQEAIFLVDPQTLRIREANPWACRLTHRTPEDLEGSPWPDLVTVDEAEALRRHLLAAAAGASSAMREVRLARADRRPLIMEISCSLVPAGGDRMLQIVGRDMTDRRTAESEREALRQRLMQSEKLSVMGELISGVAHELNNPLTGIIGYSQLLLGHPCDPAIRRNVERIQEEGKRCHRIVQNLLSFSRQRRTEQQSVAVNQVLEETLDLRSYPMRVDNIWVVKDLDPELPAVDGDPHQLQQVFMNLVTNAHQAMAGSGRDGVLTVCSRSEGGAVVVEIRDNGPGIPDGVRDRIFEPFFTTKEVGQGTGLGLAICQGILRDHAGRMELESRSGVETVFRVVLPAGGRSRADAGEAEQAGGEAGGREVRERPRRVLVVDDEDSIRDFLQEALAARGHRVDTAANGRLALDRLRERRYEAVISDLKMPGMSGRQLYEALRAADPQTAGRVIFATGDLVRRETLEFLESTGNTFLEKPFSIRSVAEALERLDAQKSESSAGR